MVQSVITGTFQGNRALSVIRRVAIVSELGVHSALNDFDLDLVIRLILRGHRPVVAISNTSRSIAAAVGFGPRSLTVIANGPTRSV